MFHEFFENLQRWNERQRAIQQLRAMPDHLLADIGVERHNIEAVVNGLEANRLHKPQRPASAPATMVLTRG